jgi:hypothetical protein
VGPRAVLDAVVKRKIPTPRKFNLMSNAVDVYFVLPTSVYDISVLF